MYNEKELLLCFPKLSFAYIELFKTVFMKICFRTLSLNSKENKLTLCNLLLCMAARRSKIKHTFQAANRMSSLKTNRLSKYNNMGLVIYVYMEENKDICFKFISIEHIFLLVDLNLFCIISSSKTLTDPSGQLSGSRYSPHRSGKVASSDKMS